MMELSVQRVLQGACEARPEMMERWVQQVRRVAQGLLVLQVSFLRALPQVMLACWDGARWVLDGGNMHV
jgi:hypothetical protein